MWLCLSTKTAKVGLSKLMQKQVNWEAIFSMPPWRTLTVAWELHADKWYSMYVLHVHVYIKNDLPKMQYTYIHVSVHSKNALRYVFLLQHSLIQSKDQLFPWLNTNGSNLWIKYYRNCNLFMNTVRQTRDEAKKVFHVLYLNFGLYKLAVKTMPELKHNEHGIETEVSLQPTANWSSYDNLFTLHIGQIELNCPLKESMGWRVHSCP